MPGTHDLGPAAHHLAGLLPGIGEDDLRSPTPCRDYSVATLLDHVHGLAAAFAAAAVKDLETTAQPPDPRAENLPWDWRSSIPHRLTELAEAWRDDEPWTGVTQAGGVPLPGELAGLVALNEITVHGWDLAAATGQRFDPDAASVAACLEFASSFASEEPDPDSPFGAAVPVPPTAPPLDRLLGLTGRDPAWKPDVV
ncbi:TIGR03086 family metal-binding protein [Saccharopolyspora griseoalba]|uniref:TIGR03086 family metal-binding protein n=1 Tax=Saccharopolyspora griseoalba TaxID=1431848 RepID=A0ABW2LGH5_9PSEU